MRKSFATLLMLLAPVFARADDAVDTDKLAELQAVYNTVQQFCGGISDRISSVSGVSKINTAVTAVGTVASGGALAVGIVKSRTDKKIDELRQKRCKNGGCDPDKVAAMSDREFLEKVFDPFYRELMMARESGQSKQNPEAELVAKSKKLGNWRTGLMAGGVATNIASAIIAGLNRNQSDLAQQITACNMAVDKLRAAQTAAIQDGVDPIQNPILFEYKKTVENCGALNVSDVEKIEKRMTVVMGTSIGGAVIGAVGTGTSIAANTNAVRNGANTESGKAKEKNLNTVANVSAGLATATGAVGVGFNISLITLTKKMLRSAEQCEGTL